MKYFTNLDEELQPLRDDIDYEPDYLEERKQFIKERRENAVQLAEEQFKLAKREAEERERKELAEITDYLERKEEANKPQRDWTDVSDEFCSDYQKRYGVSYWD